ncbi:MAG: hypothetical protein D8M59_16655 [Planctomycetes bacterium]|nr:hypothetical protein [Planctomycetota bacterium]NOG53150.1 hypothetical protein [Planctomycetota bacterium]
MKSTLITTVVVVLAGMSASAQDYAIFELPDAGRGSYGQKINTFGEVAGDCTTGQEPFHAARWTYDAGWTLDLLDVESRFYSRALDINDLGEIVGRGSMEGGDDLCTPFVWRDGVTTYLPTLGGVNGWAKGINNEGLIVGRAEDADRARAAIWDNDQVIDLGGLSELNARANDINDSNWVVGRSDKDQPGWNRAVIWKYAYGQVYEIVDISDGYISEGFAINDRNEIAGVGNTYHYAFFWDEFGLRYNIHTLGQFDGSEAYDINNTRTYP